MVVSPLPSKPTAPAGSVMTDRVGYSCFSDCASTTSFSLPFCPGSILSLLSCSDSPAQPWRFPSSPSNAIGKQGWHRPHGHSGSSRSQRLLCPFSDPAVLSMSPQKGRQTSERRASRDLPSSSPIPKWSCWRSSASSRVEKGIWIPPHPCHWCRNCQAGGDRTKRGKGIYS